MCSTNIEKEDTFMLINSKAWTEVETSNVGKVINIQDGLGVWILNRLVIATIFFD